jgi:hypothetical protein
MGIPMAHLLEQADEAESISSDKEPATKRQKF